MTEDLGYRLREEVGTNDPAPVEEIMAKGTDLQRRRRRNRTTAAIAGPIVLVSLAVFALTQAPKAPVSVHVLGKSGQANLTGGTPTPTPTSQLGSSLLDSTAQREVAVYAAVLRYEIGQLTPTGTANPANPSDSTFFVQDRVFALSPTASANDPNSFNSLIPSGTVPTDVQQGVIGAIAPTPIAFVPNIQSALVPASSSGSCDKVKGAGYVFKLGAVPLTGDQIQVYAGWYGKGPFAGAGGRDAIYSLTQSNGSWVVTGPVGTTQNTLGGCG